MVFFKRKVCRIIQGLICPYIDDNAFIKFVINQNLRRNKSTSMKGTKAQIRDYNYLIKGEIMILRRKLSIILMMLLVAGTLFYSTISAYAEEDAEEVEELLFESKKVKKPAIGKTIPDVVTVQPSDGNSAADTSSFRVSWVVKQPDGSWGVVDPTSQGSVFEAGKEYRLRVEVENLKAADGKVFPDHVPTSYVNDMMVSVISEDAITDSYYTKTDETTVSFAMYTSSFLLSELTPAPEFKATSVPTHTFQVRKDADGSELGGYDSLYDALQAIQLDNRESGKAYTIIVTRDYGEDDKTGIIPRDADVTITSSPGEQFVITRLNPGAGWTARHFTIGADSSLTLKNIVLDGNHQMGGIYSNGGVGIHSDIAAITLDKGAVIRNCLGRGSDPFTPWNGGAICMLGNGKGVVTTLKEGSRIENCQSSTGYDGGAVYVDEGTQLNLYGGVIDGCEAMGTKENPSAGGAIVLHGKMEMAGGIISNNKTNSSGGGIVVSDSGRLSITGGVIEGNQGAHGGGIFIEDSLAETKIENATIADNRARYGGGVYLYQKAALTVDNSTFRNNTAIQGGALYTGDFDYGNPADPAKYQSVTLTDSVSFTENTASDGLYTPPINADVFTNLKCAKTSITDTHIFPSDSVLTNYDINYISGDPVDPSALYQVLFQFQSKSQGEDGQILEMPQQVLELLPDPIADVTKGQTVTLPMPDMTEVVVSDGKWIFAGWQAGNEMVVNDDVTVVGEWEFQPNAGVINAAPTIHAVNRVLEIGEQFDPLDGVTAKDEEDGEITLTERNILANDVDTSKVGDYHVTYRVADQEGASAEKTITVTVKERMVNWPGSPQSPEKPQKPVEPKSEDQRVHIKKSSKRTDSPKTGDLSQIGETIFIMLSAAGVFFVLIGKKRKRNKN